MTIEEIALKLKVYEGTIIRLSEYFGLFIYDHTTESRISSKAMLNSSMVNFLEDNSNFYKKYHDDYHAQKTPEVIAQTINRDFKLVDDFLQEKFPEFYENGKFKEAAKKDLKYVSSYEIDFRLGSGNRINMNTLGRIAWHLGFKQQMIIDQMKSEIRLAKAPKKPKPVAIAV